MERNLRPNGDQSDIGNDNFLNECEKLRLLSGYVLHMTEGYNLNKTMSREKAWKTVVNNEPRLLVGTYQSTPCANLWRLFAKLWASAE